MNTRMSVVHKIATFMLSVILLVGLTAASAPAHAVGMKSVIVQAASSDHAAALVAKYNGKVTSRLDVIRGVGALIPVNMLTALSGEPGGVRVTINAEALLNGFTVASQTGNVPETDYPDVTGADLAWEQGALGDGVGVAVVDTGIANHPSLKRDASGNPRRPLVGWVDFVDGKQSPTDPNGHGTHIAGIIANASVGADGEYNGMAPSVNLVGVRVLDETGAGDYEKVIQGIQWVIDNKDTYNIKVMNLSLHSLVQSPYWADPLNQAVMQAWAEGITVVVAAGNEGPTPMTISVPGNVPYVITVGAFTDNYTPGDWNDDYLASFSAAGPTLDSFVKPDLLAPGAHITSTMLPGSYISRDHDANKVEGTYFSMAGTSQAAAVVSGAAAQVIASHPGLTPDEVKYRLMVTALPWINAEETDVLYSVWQQGAGRLNVFDAVTAQDINGSANTGLDVEADLAGTQHFEGFSYFDPATQTFRLHGFESLNSGYGSWSGGYGSWSGGYGSWSGGYGSWSGGYGSWSGGYGSWSGGYGSWSGQISDPNFLFNFMNGTVPNLQDATSTVDWVTEK